MKLILLLSIFLPGFLFSQSLIIEEKEGTVTYLSSQYVYVRFENTSGISSGDTLYGKDNIVFIPVMIIKYVSSISIAGELINGKNLNVGDKIIAKAKTEVKTNDEENIQFKKDSLKVSNKEPESTIQKTRKIKNERGLSGRISVQSYSNLSNLASGDEYQRWRYTLSLKAEDISGSGFSFYTYTNFAYRADEWTNISSNMGEILKSMIFPLIISLMKQHKFGLGGI